MHQLVTAPTFASGSLLDVCLVKNREYVRNCSVSYCHFSPHKFVNVLVDVPKQRLNPTVILSRSFKRLDVQSFNCDLLTVDWEEVYKETSVSEKWQAFLKSFMPVIDDHAPRKSVTIRNPTAPPVSAATRDLMSQRRAALRSSGRESIAYRELNRAIRSAVRRDRRVELRREIGERGPNKVWQCIRSVVAGKKDGRNVQPDLPADDLNSFFCLCRTSDRCRDPYPECSHRPECASPPSRGLQLPTQNDLSRAARTHGLQHAQFGYLRLRWRVHPHAEGRFPSYRGRHPSHHQCLYYPFGHP